MWSHRHPNPSISIMIIKSSRTARLWSVSSCSPRWTCLNWCSSHRLSSSEWTRVWWTHRTLFRPHPENKCAAVWWFKDDRFINDLISFTCTDAYLTNWFCLRCEVLVIVSINNPLKCILWLFLWLNKAMYEALLGLTAQNKLSFIDIGSVINSNMCVFAHVAAEFPAQSGRPVLQSGSEHRGGDVQ